MRSLTAPLDLTLGDLEFDLSRSLKVKSNGAVRLLIYDFLLVSNSNYMSNSHRLGLIATRKILFLSLIIRAKFRPPRPTLTPRRLFSKSNHFIPGSKRSLPCKMKLIGETVLRYDTRTDRQTDAQSDRNKPLAGFNKINY